MSEESFFANSWVIVDIFESKFFPEDIVLHKSFLGHYPHHPGVLRDGVVEDMFLNHEKDVVVE